jgi:hypothetical protein
LAIQKNNLIFADVIKIFIMSRLDRLKEQHPDLNVSIIDILSKLDPSKTNKYMEFLIKKFKEFYGEYDDWMIGLGIEMMGDDNMTALNEFEVHSKANRITNVDIGTYTSFNEIQIAVENAEEKVRLKKLEKQVVRLYNDDEWSVVIPLSYEASRVYGSNTKWCTTQERYWDDYRKTYKLIYIQNKKTNEKYAVSRHWEDEKKVQAWLSNDKETSPMLLPLPIDIMSIIIREINDNKTIVELQNKHGVESKGSNIIDVPVADGFERVIRNPYIGYSDFRSDNGITVSPGISIDDMTSYMRRWVNND